MKIYRVGEDEKVDKCLNDVFNFMGDSRNYDEATVFPYYDGLKASDGKFYFLALPHSDTHWWAIDEEIDMSAKRIKEVIEVAKELRDSSDTMAVIVAKRERISIRHSEKNEMNSRPTYLDTPMKGFWVRARIIIFKLQEKK